MSKFYWDQETIEHFKIESALYALTGDPEFVQVLRKSIHIWVSVNCDLENDETYADLTLDLLESVLTSQSRGWIKYHKDWVMC